MTPKSATAPAAWSLPRPLWKEPDRLGRWVKCVLRGEMKVVGFTAAPIPWPIATGRNYRTIPLFGDLARAVRRESAQAVMHWFGVRSHTARKWRKALGVDRAAGTEGTHRLRSEHALGPGVAAGWWRGRASR